MGLVAYEVALETSVSIRVLVGQVGGLRAPTVKPRPTQDLRELPS